MSRIKTIAKLTTVVVATPLAYVWGGAKELDAYAQSSDGLIHDITTNPIKSTLTKVADTGGSHAKVAIDFTSAGVTTAYDAVADILGDDVKPTTKPVRNGGLGGFGK